jgi:hypothetical protein
MARFSSHLWSVVIPAELARRSQNSVELSTRKAELEQLQKIAEQLSIKLEMLDVAAELPEESLRIRQIQPATIEIG